MSVELVDADKQLPIAYRNTIANMMAEAEALNGVFAPDDVTVRVVSRARASSDLPYPPIQPGADAVYEIDETLDLADVRPMIAKPFSPGNAFPAEEVARERITFDKAMIGSCTNGSYDDLLQAALVLRAAREQGARHGRAGARDLSRIGRRRPSDRDGRIRGSAASRSPQVFRSVGGADPAVVVRSVLRPGTGRADAGPARHHVVQSQLAEPHGPRRRRLPREPGRRRRVRAPRVHGAAVRAGPDVGRRALRRLMRSRRCERRLTDRLQSSFHIRDDHCDDGLTDPQIWIALATLTFLEIVLGVDNIIFISILSGKLPPDQQPRARRVGLLGAMLTRILLLFSLAWIVAADRRRSSRCSATPSPAAI